MAPHQARGAGREPDSATASGSGPWEGVKPEIGLVAPQAGGRRGWTRTALQAACLGGRVSDCGMLLEFESTFLLAFLGGSAPTTRLQPGEC